MGTWPERGRSEQVPSPCRLWSSLASPSSFRIWSMLLCYCSISKSSVCNPLKFLWCLTASPFLNRNRKLHTLRETNDIENLLKAGWEREQGGERIKEKPCFESILLFYGRCSLSLTYQQESKNWNQMKGSAIELSVAFQQSHRWLVPALAPLPLRSPPLHDTTWEHVTKDWESGQWLLMLKGHDMCTRQGIGAGCTY